MSDNFKYLFITLNLFERKHNFILCSLFVASATPAYGGMLRCNSGLGSIEN